MRIYATNNQKSVVFKHFVVAGLLCVAMVAAVLASQVDPSAAAGSQAGGAQFNEPVPVGPPGKATLSEDGRTAIAPADAPKRVQEAIAAANKITDKPYRYGGGHARVNDTGYDCSGTISFALIGAKIMKTPLDSGSFAKWGAKGVGRWITVYTNPGHAYVMIAGLRLDTSGPGEKGPRWRPQDRSARGFTARHPADL